MKPKLNNSFIVQSDLHLLLKVDHIHFHEIQSKISVFAELIKSAIIFFTYKISTVSLWNAFSNGFSKNEIFQILQQYNEFEIPEKVINFVQEQANRFGILSLRSKR